MSKSIEALITDLKAAAHEEIMFRESGDTSDKWQDDATPENVLLLIAEIERLNSPEIPDGWKLVPIEPTQNMVDAHISGMQLAGFSRAYRDMLAAAPEPQNQQQNIPENIPQGWIKCSDQMPENSTDVTLSHPEIGVFNGYCWRGLIKDKEPVFFSNSGEHDDGPKQGVTHWMPLPTAPGDTL
ncbi:TPA: DUF551 domain-containing protein [Yersinia enterocolitica]|nr:DUF551 domain-containing protein [Yersinia enterocolitica]